jgi:hypothetical protein
VNITVRDDFLDLCDQNIFYEHESDFDQLQSYDHLKLIKEGIFGKSDSVFLRYLNVLYLLNLGF